MSYKAPYKAPPPFPRKLFGACHAEFMADNGRTNGNVPKKRGLSKQEKQKIRRAKMPKKGEPGYISQAGRYLKRKMPKKGEAGWKKQKRPRFGEPGYISQVGRAKKRP